MGPHHQYGLTGLACIITFLHALPHIRPTPRRRWRTRRPTPPPRRPHRHRRQPPPSTPAASHHALTTVHEKAWPPTPPHTHATTITSVVPSHAPCSSASCLPPLHPPHAHRPYTHLAHTRKRTTHAPPTLEPLAGPARLSQLAQSNDALNSPGASGALRSDFGTTFCVGFQCLAKVWDTSSGKSTVASPVTWRPVAESRSSSRRRRRWGRRQQHA